MVDYDYLQKGCTISGVTIQGKEVKGVCTNIMRGFRMVSVQYGEDRLDNDIMEFENIKNIQNDK